MNFSNLLKILYPFCGAGENESDFVITITNNFMENSNNIHNPLTVLKSEYRKRIFEGKRNINKKAITAILNHIDKIRFWEYLSDLSDDGLRGISNSLNGYGYDTYENNVAVQCADIFENILKNTVSGEISPLRNINKNSIGIPFNNLPHKRNPYFTGREEKLKAIQDNFKSKEVISITQSVIGLGGVGKTSVALKYAYDHFKEYETIWWVNAETEQTTFNSFRDFCVKKKIIPDDAKADEIITAIKNWFNNGNNKNWIFIYDNADADSFGKWFEKYLPQNNNGHILITTRSSYFPQSTSINIDIFTKTEALLFLKKRTKKKGISYSDDLAQKLAERLQYLPLALEQAAAYIEQTPNVTYQDYNDLLEEQGVDVFDKDNYLVDYTSIINKTWNISMRKIKNEGAQQMFNMCAYFAPEKIPVDIFIRGNDVLPEPLNESISVDLERNDIIRDLTRYSLVMCETDNDILSEEKRVFYMHRLLQEVVQNNFNEDKGFIEYCLKLIYDVLEFNYGNINSMKNFEIIIPHSIKIAEKSERIFVENSEALKMTSWIFNKSGEGFLYLGKYKASMDLLNKSALIYEILGSAEIRYLAAVYNNKGSIFAKLMNYDEALKYFYKSLNIYEQTDKISPEMATCYTNIGLVYNDLKNYEKALEFCNKDLEICEKILGNENIDTAKSYTNIGLIYNNLRNYEKALEFYNKDLEICEKILSTFHPYTATSYMNIGSVYSDLAQYKYALQFYNKALKTLEKVCGEEHPDTAICYNNIAGIYKNLNKPAQSLKFYKKSLKAKEIIYGKENPDIAICYNNIGTIYHRLAEYTQALEYYSESLKIKEKIYGKENPDTAECYNNIGVIYNDLGDYKRALKFLSASLRVSKKIYDNVNTDIAVCYTNLGLAYTNLGNYKKALYYYNKDLKICEKIYGKEHPNTAICYNNIGSIYDDLKEYERALGYYNKDLKICQNIYGENHPDTAISYNNIGLLFYNMDNYDESLKYNEISLKIRKKTLGKNHPDTAQSYNNIGVIYDDLKKYEEALDLYNRALKIWEKVYGVNHPDTALCYKNIAGVYKNLKESEYALTVYNKALIAKEKIYGLNHPDTIAILDNIKDLKENKN